MKKIKLVNFLLLIFLPKLVLAECSTIDTYAICEDVKAGKYEEIPMMTVQEAGLDVEKLKEAEKASGIYEWHPHYDQPIIVYADYDNDGKEDILVYGEYTSGAGRGCDLYAFVVYDKEDNVFSYLGGRDNMGSGNDILCEGGGQRLIKYQDIYFIKNIVVEPKYAEWYSRNETAEKRKYFKENFGRMRALANYFWSKATYLDGTQSENETLGRDIFCKQY